MCDNASHYYFRKIGHPGSCLCRENSRSNNHSNAMPEVLPEERYLFSHRISPGESIFKNSGKGNKLIIRKVENRRCPACKQAQLEAIEVNEGNVSSYLCQSCGAFYDTEAIHDYDRNEHWWVGKLRNPDFWDVETNTLLDCLIQMEMKTEQGIVEYLGRYPIERID